MGVRVTFEAIDGRNPDMDQVPRVGDEYRRSFREGDTYRIERVLWTGRNQVCCVVAPSGQLG